MTGNPIDLDCHRSATERRETEMRRRPEKRQPPLTLPPHLESLEEQMLAEPAPSWGEVIEKWRFLLESYASTTEAGDERVQKLIKRALGDMDRLRKREEQK